MASQSMTSAMRHAHDGTTERTAASEQPIPAGAPRADVAPRRQRAHLYELDLMRVVTAFAVIGVHVLGQTAYLQPTAAAQIAQHVGEATLHFTREIFMFTTAFVLVYTYRGKRLDLGTFVRKRGVGVGLPYLAWTLFYVVLSVGLVPLVGFLGTLAVGVATGSGSYQLYYILLTLQFYVLFPLFLPLVRVLDRRPWFALGVSAALEVVFLWLSHGFVEGPPLAGTDLGGTLHLIFDRLVLSYQFYFVLGGLAALHLDAVRAFLLRHARALLPLAALMVLAYWGVYVFRVGVVRQHVGYAGSVLQPIMVPFSLAVLVLMGWATCRWAARPARGGTAPVGARGWRTLADASFGVYLVHPIFISLASDRLAPSFPEWVPATAVVLFIWAFAVVGSSVASIALMRTPYLRRLVGRSAPEGRATSPTQAPRVTGRPALAAQGAGPAERPPRKGGPA